MNPTPTMTEDDLHRQKYPVGSRVEVVPLADGQVLVVVKKMAKKSVPLDRRLVTSQ